ncbi:MAG: DUF188 domain-containing protein [Spirochaetales bacterium]
MQVLIDGDSCPRAVREVVAKAGRREGVPVTCFANRPIPFRADLAITMEVVAATEGAADDALVARALPGDLVVTRDIPLASRLVELGVAVLNDRGALYTAENIRERLSVRDFMAGLNAAGLKPESTAVYGKKEWDRFVRTFDATFMTLVRLTSRRGSSTS